MSDYGLKPYLSKAKTYFDFVREITDQYVNSVGVDTEPGLKRPYMYEDYYSMCYLYDTPIEYLGATPPSADELGGLTSSEVSFAESTYVSTGATDVPWNDVCMSSDGATIIICSNYQSGTNNGRIYKSDDYGITWAEIQPIGNYQKIWKSVAVDDDASVIVVSYYHDDVSAYVYVSTNSGASWTTNLSGHFQSLASDSDGSNLIAGGYDIRTVSISSNSGASWSSVNTGDFRYWSVASDADGSNLLAVADELGDGERVWVSTDSGTNWTEKRPAGDADKHWSCCASDSDGSFLVAGAYPGRLYTSANSGTDWTERQPDGNADKNWVSIACDSDGSHILVCTDQKLFLSTNSGVAWTEMTPAGAGVTKNWSSVAMNNDGTHLAACVYGGRVYYSSNSGSTWIERKVF